MKFLALLFVLFGATPSLQAMGGIWVLEIDYQYQGHRAHGFLQADYWASDWDKLVRQDEAFFKAFFEQLGSEERLTMYERVIDQEALAKAASFPMHAFFLDPESTYEIDPKLIDGLSLRKVWVKDDYGIHVLTPLELSDSTWISAVGRITYPIGEDAGCRLEVHNFSEQPVDPVLLETLVFQYLEDQEREPSHQQRQNRIAVLLRLKRQKVVVVELCGC